MATVLQNGVPVAGVEVDWTATIGLASVFDPDGPDNPTSGYGAGTHNPFPLVTGSDGTSTVYYQGSLCNLTSEVEGITATVSGVAVSGGAYIAASGGCR